MTRQTLLSLGATLLLLVAGCALTTACQDDSPEAPRTPLRLTVQRASGLPARSTYDNTWLGDGSEQVAVCVDGVVKPYVVSDPSGTLEPATGTDPFYWSRASLTVEAWYPYAESRPETLTVPYDQSTVAALEAADRLTAAATTVAAGAGTVSLTLSHSLARVEFTLTDPDGNPYATDVSALMVAPDGSIVSPCYNASTGVFSALLPPGTLDAGRPLVRLTIFGLSYDVYPSSADLALTAGTVCSFSCLVSSYSPSELKIGDYVYSDGSISDGGLRVLADDGSYAKADLAPLAGKTCVGIVFHLRSSASPTDACAYQSGSGTAFSGEPKGYIVSVDENASQWCSTEPHADDQTPNNAINGYTYTATYATKHSSKGLIAIPWCVGHTALPEAEGRLYSTWYMPCQKEYILLRGEQGGQPRVYNIVNENLAKVADGVQMGTSFYSTCALMGSWGNFLYVYNLSTGSGDAGDYANYVCNTFPYRAMCAFQ